MTMPAPRPDAAGAPSGCLIAFRWDRLGARLTTLVNTLRMAEDYGLPFRVCWPAASGMSAELNDPAELFDADFIAAHFDDQTGLGERRRAAVPLPQAARRTGDLVRLLAEGRDVAVEMISQIVVLPGEEPAQVARRCGEVFRGLPFAPVLRRAMTGLDTRLAEATACHIRRGDLIRYVKAMQKAWPNKYVPEEFFRPHIASALAAGHPVLLFSDDPALVARLQAEHPGLQAAADLVPAEGLTAAQRDLLELYAMSQCARIVAPERSAFSSTAATLGGRRLTDVKASLPAGVARAAHEALLARLQTRPDSFDGPGEIAQCLPHLAGHLVAEGRGREAARLMAGQVSGGLGISFVTAEAMALSLEHDSPEAVLALVASAAARPPMYDRDLVRCRVAEAGARALLGDAAGARRALLNGFAQDPAHPLLRLALPALGAAGALPAEGFLPNSPELFAVTGRLLAVPPPGAPDRALFALLPPGAALPERGLPEPLWVDWEPLLGCRLVRDMLARTEGGGFARALVAQADRKGASPALRGMAALLDAWRGDAAGVAALAALADEAPEDAMVLHRMSLAHHLAGQPRRAVAAAERALAACDAPLHHAWAGVTMARQRDTAERAAEYLRHAVAADTGLPGPALQLALLERRLNRTDAALAALDEAARLAPNEGTVPLTRARLLHEQGDLAGARATLEGMVTQDRVPVPAWRLLVEIEIAAGRPAAARTALEAGLLRKPGDGRLQELRAALG